MTLRLLPLLLVLLSAPATAGAQLQAFPDPTKPYVIAPPFAANDGYFDDEVEIPQGGTLDLYSYDQLPHDVTAAMELWDPETGEIPFGSDAISLERTMRNGGAPVRGVETLLPGAYGFFCTIHPQMTGTLTVMAR